MSITGSGDRRSQPPVNLEVINYQVGALQTSLDKGLFALERTVEKGFEGVDRRLSRIEERQTVMERQQERSDARLEALEEFRREQEARDNDLASMQRQELKLATDGSNTAKQLRLLGFIIAGALTGVGTLIAILGQLGAFQ